jgi:type I restriction enzyme S subunit
MAGDGAPSDWQLVKLSDLGEVNRGRSRHRPRYAEHLYGGPYPFIQTGDIKSSGGRITSYEQTYSEAGLVQSRLWPAGTMCITIAANIAETGILAFPACFPDSVVGFIADNSRCDVRFVEYTFRYLRDKIQHEASGSVQDNINLETLERLQFALPPVGEQHAIAHFLGTLDDKIELNRRMNQTLEAMARAVFKSWFVDFDPVRAKAEGRDTGLPKHIADLFPARFDTGQVGELPIGWGLTPMEHLAEVVGGSTPSTKEVAYWEGGTHHWATPKDLSALSVPVLLDTERRITDLGLQQISSGLLPKGTVLLSSRAPIGYLAVAEIPLAINQGFIAMKPRKDISNLFLLLWANLSHDEIVSRANGSTFLEINKANFRSIPVVTPAMNIMAAFERALRPVYERIAQCERESRTLAQLRDALLPKLISGEIRVKDAERLVAYG